MQDELHTGTHPAGSESSGRDEAIRTMLADPAVGANMARYAQAIRIMLTGRTVRDERSGDPEVICTILHDYGRDAIIGFAAQLDVDFVVVRFDDPAGPPARIDVVRNDGDFMSADTGCGLWLSASGGRAVLTARDPEAPQYFKVSGRRGLVARDGLPSIRIEAGCRRAGAKLHALATSDRVRREVGAGFGFEMSRSDAGEIEVIPLKQCA